MSNQNCPKIGHFVPTVPTLSQSYFSQNPYFIRILYVILYYIGTMGHIYTYLAHEKMLFCDYWYIYILRVYKEVAKNCPIVPKPFKTLVK